MIPPGNGVSVKLVGLCCQCYPALPISCARDHAAENGQDLGVIGGKRQRRLRFMLEQIELLVEKVRRRGHHPRARVGRVELNGLGRLRRNLRQRYWRLVKAEDPTNQSEPSQLAARPRVRRIEVDRLTQHLFCRAK